MSLNRNGENLFTVLRNWRDKRSLKDSYDTVIEGLRDAFPGLFEELEFEVAGQTVTANVFYRSFGGPAPISLAPDGLLVAILHLTAVAGAQPGTIVAIDEIENALHPYAIRSLARTFRHLANVSNLTIVLTTHSPVLLDEFKQEPSQVYVMEGADSPTPVQLDRLRDPEWLEHFSLGDLYSETEFGGPQQIQPA